MDAVLDTNTSAVSGSASKHIPVSFKAFWIEKPSGNIATEITSAQFNVALKNHLRLLSLSSDAPAVSGVHSQQMISWYGSSGVIPGSTYDAQNVEVREHYDRISRQIASLVSDEADAIVEAGAVNSALNVLRQLRQNSYAPPEISWHSGDAVVMLWKLGDTTYAMTITDGELGYVVRRNRKSIRMDDSISLTSFRLEDLRQ